MNKSGVMTLVVTLMAVMVVGATAFSPAFAVETVKIGGDVEQSANIRGAVSTIALGSGAAAGTSLATIHNGVETRGKVIQRVEVRGAVTTVALGSRAKACTAMASMGNNPAC